MDIISRLPGCDGQAADAVSETPILQEISRVQNLHRVEHCAFLEVTRSFQSVGCARKKLQFHTVQQNQKSFFGCRMEDGWYTRT